MPEVDGRQTSDMPVVVGITSYLEQARWGVWDTEAVLLPVNYVRAVEAAGARAVVLPSTGTHTDVLDRLDAIVFAGGADLEPSLYRQEAHEQTQGTRPQRDAAELPLVHAALERDLPTLGICRGMQLLAVAAGGALVQHLPDAVGHDRHRPAPGVYGHHAVHLQPGSRVHGILGEHTTVPSYHHQGLQNPGSMTVTGWADDDTPEVVEHQDKTFTLGVLWHPEVGDDPRLFQALVDSTRRLS